MSSKKQLTILVSYCNEAGHMNACIGQTKELLKRGHRVIFILHESWKGSLKALGFEEHLFSGEDLAPGQNPADAVAEKLEKYHITGPYSSYEKLTNIVRFFQEGPYEEKLKPLNAAIQECIDLYKPHVIVSDDHSVPPAIYYSGIPWIKSCSMAVFFEVFESDVPPGGSGLSINSDRSEWPKYNEMRWKMFESSKFNDTLEKWGYKRYPNNTLFPESQILTVYACPEELNLPSIRKKGWFNLESFNKVDARDVKLKFEELVPEKFRLDNLAGKWSGKWIYISMGSMGSVDISLMKRVVAALERSPHKYIVSKGPNHDKWDLAANMWGEKFLPQTALLPFMDLVITHGGNNTVTETFAQGKKMIVMPLFGDQYDNAQRLQDTQLGIRIDYSFSAEELVNLVEKALADEELGKRLKKASDRLQNTRTHQELADKIEQLLIK